MSTPAGTIVLSGVIPVLNGATTLGNLLQSLHAQTGLPVGTSHEIIVVDDGSTDQTINVVTQFANTRLLCHTRRRGAGAARNTGARAANGPLIVFLDADTTVMDSAFLATCLDFFSDHPSADAVSGCYYDDNGSDRYFSRYLDACEATMRDDALDRPAPGSLSGCLCVIRKEVFTQLGGFSEDPRVVLEDPDLGLRMGIAGHEHWLTGRLRVRHRQPALKNYLSELVPRTRHYLHLLHFYGQHCEVMGGKHERARRLLFLAAAVLPFASLFVPTLMLPATGILPLAIASNFRLIKRLMTAGDGIFFLAALVFHALTTCALCVGGTLGVMDRWRHTASRWRIDIGVVTSYVRTLVVKSAPGYLIHFATHRCNARCHHCFDTPQRQAIRAAHELSPRTTQRFASASAAPAHVSITGGEPLLRSDLDTTVSAYYAAGVRSFSVSTSGMFPERLDALLPKLCACAPRARIIITISIDGVGKNHDQIRGVRGLFDKAKRSLAIARTAKQWHPQLRLHACLTLSSMNIAHADETIGWLKQQPLLDQIELNRLRGQTADASLQDITDAQYAQAITLIRNAADSRGLARVFSALDRAVFAANSRAHASPPMGTCVAGRKLLVILADGTVLPCEMIRTVRSHDASSYDNFIMGKIDDQTPSLEAVLESPRSKRIVRYIQDTQCRCTFECGIFATLAYRPWALFRRRNAALNVIAVKAGQLQPDAQHAQPSSHPGTKVAKN